MRSQRRIDDQGMESIPIWDEQTRGMESIASTVSPLKVTFADLRDLDNSFWTVTANYYEKLTYLLGNETKLWKKKKAVHQTVES